MINLLAGQLHTISLPAGSRLVVLGKCVVYETVGNPKNVDNGAVFGIYSADRTIVVHATTACTLDVTPDLVPSINARTLVLVGDSRTVTTYVVGPNYIAYNEDGYLHWGMGFAGVDVNILGSSAVSGRTVQNMIDASAAEVDIYNPTDVMIFGYVNDLPNYTPSTAALLTIAFNDVTAKLTTLYNYHLNKGRFCHIICETANDSLTSAQKKLIPAINTWIKNFCDARPTTTYFYDFYIATVDTVSTTGNFIAARTADGIHLNNVGGFYCGQQMITGLQSRFPLIRLPESGYDNAGTNSLSTQLIDNPMMNTTKANGFAGTGTSGTLADDWNATTGNAGDNCVFSAPAADTTGKAINIAVNLAAARTLFLSNNNVFSRTAAGRKLYGVARIKCTTSGAMNSCNLSFNSSSGVSTIWNNPKGGIYSAALPSGWTVTVKTPVFAQSTSVTSQVLNFNIGTLAADATSVIRIERAGLIDVGV